MKLLLSRICICVFALSIVSCDKDIDIDQEIALSDRGVSYSTELAEETNLEQSKRVDFMARSAAADARAAFEGSLELLEDLRASDEFNNWMDKGDGNVSSFLRSKEFKSVLKKHKPGAVRYLNNVLNAKSSKVSDEVYGSLFEDGDIDSKEKLKGRINKARKKLKGKHKTYDLEFALATAEIWTEAAILKTMPLPFDVESGSSFARATTALEKDLSKQPQRQQLAVLSLVQSQEAVP